MALASEVLQGAQNAVSHQDQTVGDALKAYDVAQQAQQSREKLDMDKSQHEMNKANWILNGLGEANGMFGPMQKVYLQNFTAQVKRADPNIDTSGFEAIIHSEDDRRKFLGGVQTMLDHGGATNDPQAAFAMNMLGAKGATEQMDAHAKFQAEVQAGQAKAQSFNGRVDEQKNTNAANAGQHFENDDIIKNSKKNLNSLEKSSTILTKTNAPVTTKDLNLAYNDYINATAPGGAATEGKVNRELPETWAQQFNDLQQKVGATQDLRSSPQGKALIAQLTANIGNVRKDMRGQIASQAKNVAQNYSSSTNPRVAAVVKQKLDTYAPADPADSANAGGVTKAPPHGPSVIQNGHTYNWNAQTGQYE